MTFEPRFQLVFCFQRIGIDSSSFDTSGSLPSAEEIMFDVPSVLNGPLVLKGFHHPQKGVIPLLACKGVDHWPPLSFSFSLRVLSVSMAGSKPQVICRFLAFRKFRYCFIDAWRGASGHRDPKWTCRSSSETGGLLLAERSAVVPLVPWAKVTQRITGEIPLRRSSGMPRETFRLKARFE